MLHLNDYTLVNTQEKCTNLSVFAHLRVTLYHGFPKFRVCGSCVDVLHFILGIPQGRCDVIHTHAGETYNTMKLIKTHLHAQWRNIHIYRSFSVPCRVRFICQYNTSVSTTMLFKFKVLVMLINDAWSPKGNIVP